MPWKRSMLAICSEAYRGKMFFLKWKKPYTRRPVLHTVDDGQAFKFLHDPAGLTALDQLARQVTHFTRLSEKQFVALVTARKQMWQTQPGSAAFTSSSEVADLEASSTQTTSIPQAGLTRLFNRGSLEDYLAESRLILPGEDAEAYRSLVRGLWSTLKPANLLESFVAGDFAQAQWRLDRALNIQTVLFQRSAVSASGHYCGFGFGFINDVQRCQAMETMRNYETALYKRQERRLALFHKLRKEGWLESGSWAKPEP